MNYNDFMKSFSEETQKGAKTFSNGKWEQMTAAAFDKGSEVSTFNTKGDTYEETKIDLHGEVVTGLKKVCESTYGIKGPELNKLDDVSIPKEITNAAAAWGRIGPIDYTAKGGKNFDFHRTTDDMFKTQLSARIVDESVEKTEMNQKQDDGTWKRMPTGKTKLTKKHVEIRAKRVAAPWLVEYMDNT